MHNKQRAFTLLELVLVLGITLALSALVLPFALTEIRRGQVQTTAQDLHSQIFRVQQQAYAGDANTARGISFASDNYKLYSGNSLAAATSVDTIEFPAGVNITAINISGGGSELNFAVNKFRANNTGTITISDGLESWQLTINSEGLLTSNAL